MVVVFPFVPVTPTTVSSREGWRNTAAAMGPMARRTDGTRTCGQPTSSQRSTTTAAAPLASASPANAWPSTFTPGTQKNRAPGRTSADR